MILRATRTICLCGALIGCAVAVQQTNLNIQPDALGLAVLPPGQRIDFGRAPAGVVAVLDREIGVHLVMPVSGCPTGITRQKRWGDLVLSFTDERFVGWRNGSAAQGQVCTA